MSAVAFNLEAQNLIDARVAKLQQLSFADLSGLPDAESEIVNVAGQECAVSTFVQPLPSGELLAVVQVARPKFLGIVTMHAECGLVFSEEGTVREATAQELMNTGG